MDCVFIAKDAAEKFGFNHISWIVYWPFRLGSARAVNRRYISDCVPSKLRMQASAGFVSASALGMACGPAIASLLQTNFRIYKFTMNEETLPGWFMALAWLVYLLWLWICFKEPPHHEKENYEKYQEYQANTGISADLLYFALLFQEQCHV